MKNTPEVPENTTMNRHAYDGCFNHSGIQNHIDMK